MNPQFLNLDWCDRKWTEFVPFTATTSERRVLHSCGGIYRVRISGKAQLAYIGQTGRNLRSRVASLAGGTLADLMPFNDPHTAAPKLWSFRQADCLQFEASVTGCDYPKHQLMALECYLIWMYRLETGSSPLCNFGRLHPNYYTSGNRSTGLRGGVRDPATIPLEPSVPPLPMRGEPCSADWMGLSWSSATTLNRQLQTVPTTPGAYRITHRDGNLLYIGQSNNLRDRLRNHCKGPFFGASCSFAELPTDYSLSQLLETENDLIGGYFAATGQIPAAQFGQRMLDTLTSSDTRNDTEYLS